MCRQVQLCVYMYAYMRMGMCVHGEGMNVVIMTGPYSLGKGDGMSSSITELGVSLWTACNIPVYRPVCAYYAYVYLMPDGAYLIYSLCTYVRVPNINGEQGKSLIISVLINLGILAI